MTKFFVCSFFVLLMALISSVSSVFAQSERYPFMSAYSTFDSARAKGLYFRFENQNFFRNDEYQSAAIEGYTLIGLWGRPLLEYYPTNNLKIRLGGHFLRYQGDNGIDEGASIPYYSLQYNPFDNFEIIMGNIDNSQSFGLPEMMYEPEYYLSKKPPGGVQIRYRNRFLTAQVWINWETFIRPGDSFQEVFTNGTSVELNVLNKQNLQIDLPLHFTYHHQGGEIASRGAQIETLMNGIVGLNTHYSVNKWVFGSEMNYLGYREATNTRLQPYAAGHAALARVSVKFDKSFLSVGYWYGDRYLSPKGRVIYRSFGHPDATFDFSHRRLFESRFVLNVPIKNGVALALEADAFYDTTSSELSYCYGIHLTFSESFLLHKME